MAKARDYPKANRTAQWWEGNFDRGRFSRIEKILLHTTETTSWPGYKAGASAPTLTYHPRRREWRQHNYLDTSARALVDPTSTAVRENRDNVIQIEIIAYSDERVAESVGGLKVSDLTDVHYRDLAEFFAFIRREWGGPPLRAPKFLAYPGSYGNSSVRMSGPEYDSYQGLVGHQHASGNDHGDPSNIDAPKILRMVQAIEGGTTPTSPKEDEVTEEQMQRILAAISAVPGQVLNQQVKHPTLKGETWGLKDAMWSTNVYAYQGAVGSVPVADIVAGVVTALGERGQAGSLTAAELQSATEAGVRAALGSLDNTPEA